MAAPSLTYTLTNGTTADASQVMQNFNDLLNGYTDGTKDLSISALTCAGTATFNGHVNLGNSSADDLTITASLASTIPIKTTNSYDIGSATLGLRALYFGANSQTVNIKGSSSMSATWTLTLPVTAGTADYVLATNGSGVTSWTQIADANVSSSAAISGSKLVAATASVAGAVSIAAQSFAGLKKFEGGLIDSGYVSTNPEVGGSSPFTMTNSHRRLQILAIAADATILLPTTGVVSGEVYEIVNRHTGAFDLTVQSSGGNTIDILRRGYIKLKALQAAPTTSSHWEVVDVYEEYNHSSIITNVHASTVGTFRIVRHNRRVSVTLSSSYASAGNKPNTTDPVTATGLVARFRPAATRRFAHLYANATTAIGYATLTSADGLITWSKADGSTWSSAAAATIYENTFTYDLMS